ncbi:MAG TPA: hypothetical protein VK021_04295 [Flavobacteriaceae bacterium]|nr:hypothetical protein [Flavobacteriaceae bacterium]
MRKYNEIILGILLCIVSIGVVKAQDVNITVPAQHIFNHTEFTTVKTVMHTGSRINWNYSLILLVVKTPTFRSISGNNFIQEVSPEFDLPSTVLQWQLASIGGALPPFGVLSGSLPGFKHFTSSKQNWYNPPLTPLLTGFPRGEIKFTFKIPSNKFANNIYHVGDYSIKIDQNYDFTPSSFYVILSVPKAISWLTTNNIGYSEINSLDDYRTTPENIILELGSFELGNTMDFNLFAESTSPNIQFTSNKGTQENIDISLLKLGGNHLNILTQPLTSTEQNFTSGNSFEVEIGNRNSFQLHASLSKADFKNHFFQAGTYNFQIDLSAKSIDNTIVAPQTIDYTLKVLPLSEIKIPNVGQTVNFEFNTAEQYQNGQIKTIPNQIRISNNETYELYVKSDAPFFTKEGIQTDVPASILEIGIDGGSPPVSLSTTPEKIANNGMPVLDKDLTMKYAISAESAQALVPKDKGTYTTNIIYSFTAL